MWYDPILPLIKQAEWCGRKEGRKERRKEGKKCSENNSIRMLPHNVHTIRDEGSRGECGRTAKKPSTKERDK